MNIKLFIRKSPNIAVAKISNLKVVLTTTRPISLLSVVNRILEKMMFKSS